MKIDDDNLFDKKKWKKIREYIINKKPNRYINYWWYNLLKNKKWIIWISEENKYIWRYWDHWIFPISKYTYFSKWYDNWWYNEYFNNNLLIKRFDFSFYHLKYLKKNYWLTNVLNTKSWKLYYNMVERWKIIELKDKEILKIIK